MKMAPPEPPPTALDDDDRLRRMHVRLWQLSLTLATVLVTAWVCTFGWVPAVLALMTAKHILVAILAWGLNLDASSSKL